MNTDLVVRQLPLGRMDNFTYIVGDKSQRDAFVIDPAGAWSFIETALKEDSLNLKGVLLTHGHYDHIVGVEKTSVPVYLSCREAKLYIPKTRNLVRTAAGEKIGVGKFILECIHTPGHTPGCQCFLIEGNLFTGDTLFIDAIGRTDFPGGDIKTMFESLQAIKRLPDATEIWPGHNYGIMTHVSLGKLKASNMFLACNDKEVFFQLN